MITCKSIKGYDYYRKGGWCYIEQFKFLTHRRIYMIKEEVFVDIWFNQRPAQRTEAFELITHKRDSSLKEIIDSKVYMIK